MHQIINFSVILFGGMKHVAACRNIGGTCPPHPLPQSPSLFVEFKDGVGRHFSSWHCKAKYWTRTVLGLLLVFNCHANRKNNHFNCVFFRQKYPTFCFVILCSIMTSELTSGFIKVVLGSFDGENFRRQKRQLSANKCFFFKTFCESLC